MALDQFMVEPLPVRCSGSSLHRTVEEVKNRIKIQSFNHGGQGRCPQAGKRGGGHGWSKEMKQRDDEKQPLEQQDGQLLLEWVGVVKWPWSDVFSFIGR